MKRLSQFLFLEVFMLFSCAMLPACSMPATDFRLSSTTEALNDLNQLPISDESTQRIYLLRHGESTANVYFEVNGKKMRHVSGQSTDIPLTEAGEKQIQELAERLAERFPEQAKLVIVSSSAKRTQHTAKILFERLSQTHSDVTLAEEVYPGLNERSLGASEGRLKDEYYAATTAVWNAMPARLKFFLPEVYDGERYIDVAIRALLDLEEIYNQNVDKTVIAVTSFNTINAVAIQINPTDALPDSSGTPLPKMDLGNGDLVLFEINKEDGFQSIRAESHIKSEL